MMTTRVGAPVAGIVAAATRVECTAAAARNNKTNRLLLLCVLCVCCALALVCAVCCCWLTTYRQTCFLRGAGARVCVFLPPLPSHPPLFNARTRLFFHNKINITSKHTRLFHSLRHLPVSYSTIIVPGYQHQNLILWIWSLSYLITRSAKSHLLIVRLGHNAQLCYVRSLLHTPKFALSPVLLWCQ